MATPAKSTPKGSRKTLIVTMAVPGKDLERIFGASSRKTSSSTPNAKIVDSAPTISQPEPSPPSKSEDSNSTPVPATGAETPDPNSLAPPPKVDGRRKRGGGAATGRKRAAPMIDPNAPPRERGRPGPKKKPRLPDGSIDRSAEGGAVPVKAVGNAAAHKLGPKANTGAINAGLRALDRSGKPCRRWEKKGLQLKSFTGAVWGMSSWGAPSRANGIDGNGETKSDSSSEIKPPGSSAMPSDKESHGGDNGDTTMMDTTMMTGMESSPAPAIAA